MVGEQDSAILDQIDDAVAAVPELAIRRVGPAHWERRSAQVWYRVTAHSGEPLPAHQVQVNIAIVVPLLERLVPDMHRSHEQGTIGGNLLVFALDSDSAERTFELVPASRRGKIAARLRAPVLGDSSVRTVSEGAPFVADLTQLLRERMAPWSLITSWAQVAEALAAYGDLLAGRGLVDRRHRGLQGVLRWAGGAEGVGEQLIVEDFGRQAPEILGRLQARFAPQSFT